MTARKYCLVVDDSEVIREIAARIVTELGLGAESVEDAASAIEHCSDNRTDVVLLDWDLPAMGALDFLRGAAELKEEMRPEIILCATENDPQQFTLAKAAGARHHILKPFDKQSIAAKLSEIGVVEGHAPDSAKAAAGGRQS
ncbi:response regulator [Hyphococcus sp.]|uniref:response regulator n=1 Tax=Hyphococcus sp. TaxID=2038636 RepID=UPI003CCB8969